MVHLFLPRKVPQRGKLVFFSRRVHTVIDSDVARIILRENDFDNFPGFQVVPAQAGRVLGNNRRHISGFHLTQQSLKPLTLKDDFRNTVIDEKASVKK